MPSKPSGFKHRPKKSFSQNFLVNLHAVRRIVESLNLSRGDKVLEVGAGKGVLTQFLAEKAAKVYAVELDKNLVLLLQEKFAQAENVEIISGDILKVNLESYASRSQKIKLVGNLPYQITSPILDWMVNQREFIQLAVVTVQKEVARRICAQPGTKEWSPLSIFSQIYTQPKILFTLSAGSFFPAPKVQSAVVRLQMLNEPVVRMDEEKSFFDLVHIVFSARRKTLVKALTVKGSFPREKVEKVLHQLGLKPNTRGETLTLDQLAQLSKSLKQIAG